MIFPAKLIAKKLQIIKSDLITLFSLNDNNIGIMFSSEENNHVFFLRIGTYTKLI